MRSSALWLAALMVIALAAPGESEGGPPPGPPADPLQALAASLWGYLARPPPPTGSAPGNGGSGPATTPKATTPMPPIARAGMAAGPPGGPMGEAGLAAKAPPLLPSGTPMTPPPPGHMDPPGSSGPPPWRIMAPPVAKAVIPDPPAVPAPSHTAETPETPPVVDLTSAPPPPAETMNHTVDLRICKLCQKQTYAGRGQCFNKNCEPGI